MTGNVIPFDRGRRSKPAAAAASRARNLAKQQASDGREKYARAQHRQEEERLLRTGRPVPARITLALDAGGHQGPEVDTACGAAEPAVDLWECGVEVPTGEQVKLLARLTGFPVAFFYERVEPGPLPGGDGRMWICGPRSCTSPEPDYVDEHGVLHYGGEPPRTPPPMIQGALF